MRRAGLLRLATLALIWGTSFLWIKVALRGLSPGQIVFARLSLGAAVLLGFVWARGTALPRGTRTWGHLCVAALFANVIPYLLFAYGEQEVDSAIAGVLNATTPLWTVVFATAVGLEARPRARKLGGLGLGFAGALVIFEPWQAGSQVLSWGGLACLAAAGAYGVSFVYMARFLAGRGLTPLALAAGQLVAASALSLVALGALGWDAPAVRADALVSVAILGVLGTGAAYVLNYRLIVVDGASAASVVTYLIPVVAAVVGAAALHETLPWNVVGGMVVVLVGVALARAQPAPEPVPAPEVPA
jgi:drug/metabolite transporter (DMT)-like permease